MDFDWYFWCNGCYSNIHISELKQKSFTVEICILFKVKFIEVTVYEYN